jgi:hypothetical protein
MEKKRRKEIIRDVLVQFKVTREENEKIEALAEKLKMNKSKLIRNIVLGDIEDSMWINMNVLPIMQKAKAFYVKHKDGLDYWSEIKKED